ncbi:MAG: hypothetical protein V4580_14490 [Bacteroidota bacterium]
MYKSKLLRSANFYIGSLGFLFCIMELIIHPVGNFPLNDEWLYAHTTFDFSKTNVIDTSAWGYTSMLTHILYGSFFIKLFGLSYSVLHYSTLVWSFFGIVCFYRLLNDFFVKQPFHSFLMTLLMLANPLYISLSNSFMTDIPFLANTIIALFFYLKYRSNKQFICLMMSALFFIWAILIRQLAFAFVAGIFISELMVDRKKILPALGILLTASLFLGMFEYWLHAKGVDSYHYLFFSNANSLNSESLLFSLLNFSKRWIHYMSFSGFVLFPLLIPSLVSFLKNREFSKSKSAFLISTVLFIPVAWSMQKFPIGNYFYNTGIGPETLLDTYILQTNNAHSFSVIFYGIKAVTYLGAFTLLFIMVNHVFLLFSQGIKVQETRLPYWIIGCSLFFYYSFLAIASPIFDRYIMVFSVFVIPLIYKDAIAWNLKLILPLIFILMLFSVFATKDYFSGHETRWAAIDFLKTQYKVKDEDINGGLEHESKVFYKTNNWFGKWQNVPKNKYVISYGNLKGYRKFTWFTFQRCIPRKRDTIFVLKDDEQP